VDPSGEIDRKAVASAWDGEYRSGRYATEPPLPFVDDIVLAATLRNLREGVYVGCGNGRNYIGLVNAGIDLLGLDVSAAAIQQLAQRMPERRHRLVTGDLTAVAANVRYGVVIGIQVFQHGHREEAAAHIRAAQERVADGGLFCLRVNADATDVLHRHEVAERTNDGSYTVRYLGGPKKGLWIHFFSRESLSQLFSHGFVPVMPLRLSVTQRDAPETGQWSQWEGIWRRTEHSGR
jgi:SAM-dependent methyltransferase